MFFFPQMSPMLWFSLYLYVLLLLMLFMVILYFFVIYKHLDNYEFKICAFKNFLFKW